MFILAAIVVPSYIHHVVLTRIQTSSEDTLALLQLAQSYSVALNQEISVSINRTQGNITGFNILSLPTQSEPHGHVLNQLVFPDNLSATLNPTMVHKIIFRPHGSIQLLDAGNTVLASQNCLIQLSYQQRVTSDILIYYYSGVAQLVPKK